MKTRLATWFRLVTDSAAATAVEYAVILALLATALVVASHHLPWRWARGQTQVAALLFGDPAAGQSGGAGRSSTDQPGTGTLEPSSGDAALAGKSKRIQDIPGLVAWGALLLAAAMVVSQRLRQRWARRQVHELDLSTEESPEAPNPRFVKRQEIRRVLLKHLAEVLQSRILVRHVMSRKVRAVEPSTPVAALREVMAEEGFHHLLVMKQEKLLGVISDRDLCGRCGKRAGDLMTSSPRTVSPDTPIGQAITSLLRHRISCLPVVEGQTVQGILTTTDLLLTLQCLLQLLEQAPALADGSAAVVPA